MYTFVLNHILFNNINLVQTTHNKYGKRDKLLIMSIWNQIPNIFQEFLWVQNMERVILNSIGCHNFLYVRKS